MSCRLLQAGRLDGEVGTLTVTATDPGVAVRREPDARARIRAARAARRSVIAVLDDDPTGSQTVHDVEVVTVLDPDEIAAALDAGDTCFLLTNTRALSEAEATGLNRRVAAQLIHAAGERGRTLEIVSRSDSTLRGHVPAEVAALAEVAGAVDGVLFAPAFLEAGRVTAGDTHWAEIGGSLRPVGETEFARDATFGYAASDLRQFLAERSGGAIKASDVHSIGLDDIRRGGPDRVRELLGRVRGGAWVVVNALDYADLDVVALGLQDAVAAGQRFLHRCGPSWVQVLAGLDPAPPLVGDQVATGRPGHGLVVVGSHVAATSAQVERAVRARDLAVVELDARRLAAGADAAYLAAVAGEATRLLAERDVVLMTSRELLRAEDRAASLDIATRVSSGVTAVVAQIRTATPPAWVVTKGGITSHDVATTGLGIRRARVAGQALPGMVSVMRPTAAPPEIVGMPWVVFAGNVGDADTLGHVVALMTGDAR